MKLIRNILGGAFTSLLISFCIASASEDPKLSPNPVYQAQKPLFTAQGAGSKTTVYDSYWTLGKWKIHCSQAEFCYLHLPASRTKNYDGGEVIRPIQWERGRKVDHSIAFGIKGGTIRTNASIPFFSWNGRTFTDDFDDYKQNGKPHVTATYIIDGKEVATRDHGKKAPLKVSMWGDWEADTRPLIKSLLTNLYHNDPKEMEIRISIDNKPAIGLVFDVTHFKTVHDNMIVEKTARKTHNAGKGRFASWPSVDP